MKTGTKTGSFNTTDDNLKKSRNRSVLNFLEPAGLPGRTSDDILCTGLYRWTRNLTQRAVFCE